MRGTLKRGERGSASVIVILIMLLLVVFGVLAFVSATSSIRLAEKNAHSVRDYYLLDGLGERAVLRLQDALNTAEGRRLLNGGVRQELADWLSGTAELPGTVALGEEAGGVLELNLSDPGTSTGATLRIRVQPVPGPERVALKVQEWKLINKPFDFEQTQQLWEGPEQ